MLPRDFCYWLQGFFELSQSDGPLSGQQVAIIKSHLSMVFTNSIDLTFGDKDAQEMLNKLHNTKPGEIVARC